MGSVRCSGLGTVMLDPADEIEKKLCGKRCRAAGEIIIGGHLDQIDTDDITPLCEAI